VFEEHTDVLVAARKDHTLAAKAEVKNDSVKTRRKGTSLLHLKGRYNDV